VYGDSPPEWRKSRLAKFARRVAADVDALHAADPLPVVLVANAELGGHFQWASSLGAQLVGTVETNPGVLDVAALHKAVYSLVQPRLDASRREAADRFAALLGQGDPRAVVDIGDVVGVRTGDSSTACC
jgi:Bacterial archaeo-eukaryotic release factor family 3